MMSWPASPRIRIRPIGPGSPIRKLGAPRWSLAIGASDRSGRWPSRVCTTRTSALRAALKTAWQGPTAPASWVTSLPSVAPKPPGSRKSRCMSMMTSAVFDQSSSIGAGSAGNRLMVGDMVLSLSAWYDRQKAGSVARTPPRSVSRHVPADFGQVRFAGAGLVDELAVEHDDEAVGEFDQFVEG